MRWIRRGFVGLIALSLLAVAVAWLLLRASLPQLDGEVALVGLSAPVRVERDALGTVTIRAENRRDVAFALGYAHAQERYFEMDLLRRRAAGELAALFGTVALEADREARVHRFRQRVPAYLAAISAEHRGWMQAYTDGANAGLVALSVRPFPYLLLRQPPRPWTVEDCLLAPLAMYFTLQDSGNRRELKLERMRAALAPEVYAFLTAAGGEWDAPLLGDPLPDPAIPPVGAMDLRGTSIEAPPLDSPSTSEGIGSNNFAVAGRLTPHGGAILANDMHLGLRVPGTWFRAQWRYPNGAGGEHVVTGATLPGTPIMVVGSNGHIAWGFTNSYGDWADFVEIDLHPQDPQQYREGEVMAPIRSIDEIIEVAGGPAQSLQVRETLHGPVIARSSTGKPLVLQWVAHHAQGANAGLAGLESARSLEEALAVSRNTGIPAQNLLVAGADGRIAWTVIGALPRRPEGVDSRFPLPSAQFWRGWLPAQEVPAVIDPPDGRLWTANARNVSGEMQVRIGDGGYTLGARGRQIRDGLRARARLAEADLLAIALDDRALFLERWHRLLAQLLRATPDAELRELADAIVDWNGRAEADTRGYRLVRDFRQRVHRRFLQLFEAPLRVVDPEWSWPALPQLEGAVWATLQQRPAHLLPQNFQDWDDWLRAAARDVVANLARRGRRPIDANWGELNTSAIRHPLSGALPGLGWLLDMPAQALDGDQYMPRVQGPRFGASERMVVSPGHEDAGIFHMPGGQSGHPLSPFYGAGHQDWVQGRASPFLPGPPQHALTLRPAR
ncbi:MAG: penicillin acylase family protein [Xanthomonadales bacterium]|nr:Penicillin acylase 2 proenzyme [Anaerolineae bacterium]MCC6592702.1 penicillin acylase family protein [Xanthomonadales bacterium]MCE7931913.1 penicillin acylase family protein [Xanthomonadales bacterium PRO6]